MLHHRTSQQHDFRGQSQLAAIRVGDIDDSLEVSDNLFITVVQWFGNYTEAGETPIILIPDRSSCAPYIYV